MLVDHRFDAIGREHFERARERGFRKRMRVHAQKQRPIDARAAPVQADGLADGQDMRLIEGSGERRAAMPRGAEGDALRSDRGIRHLREIGGHQPRHIDQHRWRDGLSRERAYVFGHVILVLIPKRSARDAWRRHPPRNERLFVPAQHLAIEFGRQNAAADAKRIFHRDLIARGAIAEGDLEIRASRAGCKDRAPDVSPCTRNPRSRSSATRYIHPAEPVYQVHPPRPTCGGIE